MQTRRQFIGTTFGAVKLSASPLMSKESYPFADMTPHIRALFDAYGPRRCYWAPILPIRSTRPRIASASRILRRRSISCRRTTRIG